MGKVAAGLFITLDGVVQAPENWSFDSFDADMGMAMGKAINGQDAVLLGRVTYEEWVSYWPTSDNEPFASFINSAPKYVFSKSLNTVNWQNSTLVKGDLVEEVTKLKQQYSKNVGTTGSPSLVRSLLAANLLDELILMVYPVIAGSGARLFTDNSTLKRMKLIDSSITASGVAILTYTPLRE